MSSVKLPRKKSSNRNAPYLNNGSVSGKQDIPPVVPPIRLSEDNTDAEATRTPVIAIDLPHSHNEATRLSGNGYPSGRQSTQQTPVQSPRNLTPIRCGSVRENNSGISLNLGNARNSNTPFNSPRLSKARHSDYTTVEVEVLVNTPSWTVTANSTPARDSSIEQQRKPTDSNRPIPDPFMRQHDGGVPLVLTTPSMESITSIRSSSTKSPVEHSPRLLLSREEMSPCPAPSVEPSQASGQTKSPQPSPTPEVMAYQKPTNLPRLPPIRIPSSISLSSHSEAVSSAPTRPQHDLHTKRDPEEVEPDDSQWQELKSLGVMGSGGDFLSNADITNVVRGLSTTELLNKAVRFKALSYLVSGNCTTLEQATEQARKDLPELTVTHAPVTINTHFHCRLGDVLVMCGDLPQLGGWNVEQSVGWASEFPPNSGNWSVAQLDLPMNVRYEWKWALVRKDGSVLWEKGPGNRVYDPLTSRSITKYTAPWEYPNCSATKVCRLVTEFDIRPLRREFDDATVAISGDMIMLGEWAQCVQACELLENHWEVQLKVPSHTSFTWKWCIYRPKADKIMCFEKDGDRTSICTKQNQVIFAQWSY